MQIRNNQDLTIRDEFAKSAPPMPAMMIENDNPTTEDIAALEAKWRYMYADAMLKERKKKYAPLPSRNNVKGTGDSTS